MEKIINKIQKKIDAIEKLHDKESLMCEEVKDVLEELRENQEEKGFIMAKDIKLYKDRNEITINETQLDNFLDLGWKQDQDKQVKTKK